MDLIALLCLTVFYFTGNVAAIGIMMDPVKESATQAALMIVPGANIQGQAYRPLALQIQKTSPLKLWVVLLDNFIYNPESLELPSVIASSITELKGHGMTSNNIFLSGHSLGGVFAGRYGKSNASQLKGILLFASYLTRDITLSSYPVPVLHLSGDLDGSTRITRLVDTFQELKSDLAHRSDSKYRTPVILMPGVNHAQFASGAMPNSVTDKDLTAEVTPTKAFRMIAKHVSAFLVYTLAEQVRPRLRNQAQASLNTAFADTLRIMHPLIKVKTLEQNGQSTDSWVIQAQTLVAGLNSSSKVNVLQIGNQILPDPTSFISSKPSVNVTENHVLSIQTYAQLTFALNPLDISTHPSAPQEVAYKMKSREAIQQAASTGGLSLAFNYQAANITCKDLNQAAFYLALQSSSFIARRRYKSHGRPISFEDDVMHTTSITWSTSGLDLQEDVHGLNVTSHELLTKTDASPAVYAGMHYCKGLSPYRAMEWIYVDSLRSHPI